MVAPLLAATAPDIAAFACAAAIVVLGALGVVAMRNPVHAALSLIMTLFGVAVLFVEENAQFLAAVQVIVYAGAIVVLFLFVIMLLGIDRREAVLAETFRGQRVAVVGLGLCVLFEIFYLARNHWTTGAPSVAGKLATSPAGVSGATVDNTAQLGRAIFTTYLLPFEVTSALLVVAVVGAVVLARRPQRVPSAPSDAGLRGEEIPSEGPHDPPGGAALEPAPHGAQAPRRGGEAEDLKDGGAGDAPSLVAAGEARREGSDS